MDEPQAAIPDFQTPDDAAGPSWDASHQIRLAFDSLAMKGMASPRHEAPSSKLRDVCFSSEPGRVRTGKTDVIGDSITPNHIMIYQIACDCNWCAKQHPKTTIGTPEYGAWMTKRLTDVKTRQMTQERSCYWSVTFFNGEQNGSLPDKWKLEGQLEIAPETGKEHYQGMLHTPQVRFSQVKKAFPKAHIEAARDPEALQKYVHKNKTRKTPDREISEYAEHTKINRTKFFEDVLEYMFNNVYDSCLNGIKEDTDYSFLTMTVNAMVEAGGDWAYCSMAVQPITRCIWRDYRVAMWESFVAQYTNADDNEVPWNEDTGDVAAIPVAGLEEAEDESEAESEQTASSSDQDDSKRSSGDEVCE